MTMYVTAAELARTGRLPEDMDPPKQLILSSPATVDINSPGARGFGVKRAGLTIPDAVMLLVSPRCCGRNTTVLCGELYRGRTYYLTIDETDMITGRYLERISEACAEICDVSPVRPSAVLICSTCTDALLGTDMDRICRQSEELCGVRCVPLYMNALARDGRLPPVAQARVTAYSLLGRSTRRRDECGIIGAFLPLYDTSEIYPILHGAGIRRIHELARCRTMDEYDAMSASNFHILIDAEARAAAADMYERLGIPYVELVRTYDTERVHRQYALLGDAIGADLDDALWYDRAAAAVEEIRSICSGMRFAVGAVSGSSFDMALSLITAGMAVTEIYASGIGADMPDIRRIAALSPDTRIYITTSPAMHRYASRGDVDVAVGRDAGWYHPEVPCVRPGDDHEPFGYDGILRVVDKIAKVRGQGTTIL